MTRVVQLQKGAARRVALVEEPHLRLLAEVASVYELAGRAFGERAPLTVVVGRLTTGESIDYDSVYSGESAWRLLPPNLYALSPIYPHHSLLLLYLF